MSKFVMDEPAWQRVREAAALGILNACHAIEGTAKSITPVHGDPTQGGPFSTFAPGAKPIGGTLRRSLHSAVYLDGQRIGGPGTDENGTVLPTYVPRSGIAGFVGTNIHYAGFVHDGTVKMEARPFLATAVQMEEAGLLGLIQAGMDAALRRQG